MRFSFSRAISAGLFVAVLSACLPSRFSASAQAAHVSRDAAGWTAVTPSADSRLIYVSSSAGNDANDGLSQSAPVKSLSKGMSLLRAGYPDWLLLKSGDVWTSGFAGTGVIQGRSAGEPMVMTSYGSGPKPQIRPSGTGQQDILHVNGAPANAHFYLMGLEFYDPRKDPSSPSFSSSAPETTGFAWIGAGSDILVENCDFHFLSGGIVMQRYDNGALTGVTLRRNRLMDNYSFNSGNFSQGAFLYGIDGLTVEENVFDANGYNRAAGVTATVFVHNAYIDECQNATVARNLLMRAGSLSLKFRSDHAAASANTVAEDNLVFESEVGIGAAADGSVGIPAQATLTGFAIRNNVILQTNRDNPTGRGLGWGISLNDIKDSSVTGNIVSDLSFTGNSYALSLGDGMETAENHPISGISIAGNIAYRVNSAGFSMRPAPSWSGVTVTGNDIQNPDQPGTFAIWDRDASSSAVAYSGNRYYDAAANPAGFAWVGGSISGHQVNYAGWVAASGETGSSYGAVTYPDPARNLETYSRSLGQPATVDAFIAGARAQTKGNWQAAYTATAVNDYIRAGFGLAALGSGSLPTNYSLAYSAAAHGSLSGSAAQTVASGGSGAPVTAVADAGYHFVAWSDGSSANPRADANVSANVTVTANFAINSYALSYAAGANGSLSGSLSQTVQYGGSGTAVTAVPASGYQFSAWSDGSSANPRADANVSANVTVTANFSSVASSGGGSSSSSSSSSSGSGGSSVPAAAAPSASPSSSAPYDPAAALALSTTINADKKLSGTPSVCVSGTLIKGSFAAVYYCGADGKRYVFANDKVYLSWYDDFLGVTEISDESLAAVAIGGNVTYRPGRRMVKIQSDPRVYAVDAGGVLRWVSSEAAAARLYGSGWNSLIDDIPDYLFVDYKTGSPIY